MNRDPFRIHILQEIVDQMCDPFRTHRFQEIIDQTIAPARFIQRYVDVVNETTRFPIAEVLQASSNRLFDFIKQQDFFGERALQAALSETFQRKLQQIQEIANRIIYAPATESLIPDRAYPKLQELVNSLENTLSVEEKNVGEDSPLRDVAVWIRQQIAEKVMTWSTLKWFIGLALSTAIAFYISDQSAIQTERHHREDYWQRERHHKETISEIQNSRNNYDKQIKTCGELVDCLDPYFPSAPELPESDPETPE